MSNRRPVLQSASPLDCKTAGLLDFLPVCPKTKKRRSHSNVNGEALNEVKHRNGVATETKKRRRHSNGEGIEKRDASPKMRTLNIIYPHFPNTTDCKPHGQQNRYSGNPYTHRMFRPTRNRNSIHIQAWT